MAATIQISIPPNTNVVLPDSAMLTKALGSSLPIAVDNQAGETITLSNTGSATSFSVAAPASIANDVEDSIDLEVLAAGSIVFLFAPAEETITVQTPAPSSISPATTIALARRARFGAIGRPAP